MIQPPNLLHDGPVRRAAHLLLHALEVLLDKELVLGLLAPVGGLPRRWPRLHERALALAAPVLRRVDAARVAPVRLPAPAALPHVLVCDLVRVPGRHLDAAAA